MVSSQWSKTQIEQPGYNRLYTHRPSITISRLYINLCIIVANDDDVLLLF